MQRYRKSLIAIIFILFILSSGCSAITDPFVSVDPNPPGSYAEAEKKARVLAAEYTKRLQELDQFELWSGTAMFGAAAAGVGSAIFQAHHGAVLGAALAGGIIGGARALFPTTTRKNIYVQGSAAVDCAVIATSLGNPAPSDADNRHSSLIARQLANADSNVASLRTNLETIRPRLSFSSGFAQAGGLARLQAEALLSTVETAQIKLDEANAALIQVEATNPQTLYRALHVIARAVDSQLANNSVNVDSAIKALNGVIDAAQKKLADALKAAKETNNNAKENAKQLEATGERLTALASGAKAVAPHMSVDDVMDGGAQLKALAEQVDKNAKERDSAINTMLDLIGLQKGCLGTLTS